MPKHPKVAWVGSTMPEAVYQHVLQAFPNTAIDRFINSYALPTGEPYAAIVFEVADVDEKFKQVPLAECDRLYPKARILYTSSAPSSLSTSLSVDVLISSLREAVKTFQAN